MLNRFYQFSELDEFMQYYSPHTPYGIGEKIERPFFSDEELLNKIFDRVELLINFIKVTPQIADKVEYHLSRIPHISLDVRTSDLRSEIFSVKKFLHNFKVISSLLNEDSKNSFSLEFHSEKLLTLLGHELNQEETFYLNDSYSSELRIVRQELRDLDNQLADVKEKRYLLIKNRTGLDFRFHNFLVIEESKVLRDSDSFLYIETYDMTSVIVKPVLGKEYFHIHNSRKTLLEKEKAIEQEILIYLKNTIEEEIPQLKSYISGVTSFDVTLAKARLAIRFNCTRPELFEKNTISFIELNFVPLKEKCNKTIRKYTPLTASFDQKNIVVSGSNMGGKSVLLKSIAFSQLLVQYGFFVPAHKISTCLFRSLYVIGKIDEDWDNGLSSFGEEIMNIIETEIDGKTLFLVDEFARTTNSREAYALNSALLQWFSEKSDVFSFLSTHLDNLPELSNVSFWTMKGLDYEKYSRYYHKDFNRDLNERIRIINEFMDYSVEPQENKDSRKDALKIADILGLDSKLIKYARKYIKMQENKNGQ